MTSDAQWVESMPAFYARLMGPMLFDPYAERLAAMAAELAPQRILETAAGTGAVTAALHRTLPSAQITATDLNDAMVEYGRTAVPGATWQQADAQALAFEDASFDLVVTQFGVMFFPDRPGAFAEAARVLAPGGRVLFTAWEPVARNTFAADLDAALAELWDDPPDWLHRMPYGYHDEDVIRADVTAGGLVVEAFERVVLPSSVSSPRDVAEGFGFGSPLRFSLVERGDLDMIVTQLGDVLVQRFGDAPRDGDLAAVIVTARKAD